jgi:hypothetical protein
MNKQLKSGAALLFAAGALTFVGTAPARAVACPNSSVQLGTLIPLSYSCDQGNFTFTLTGFTGFVGTDSIAFSNPTADKFTYGIQANAPWTVGGSPYTFSYSVAALAPNQKIVSYTSDLSSSVAPGTDAGTWSVTGNNGPAITSLGTPAATLSTSPILTTATFTGSLNVTAGNIQQVNSTITAQTQSTSEVPSPLPILGAGAAFSFSRRIRNRIKLAA